MIAVAGCIRGVIRVVTQPPEASEEQTEQEENLDYRQDPYAWQAAEEARMQREQEKLENPVEEEDERTDDDIYTTGGGCAFNIAVHLAEAGEDVEMLSVVGDDLMGEALKEELKNSGVKTDGVKVANGATATDVKIVNILGDVQFMGSNDKILDEMTDEFFKENGHILDEADVIVMDGSLPESAIEYVAGEYGDKDDVKIFFDPAGLKGGGKAENVLDRLHCVMPGRMEAEAMTGNAVLSEEELSRAGDLLSQRGVDKAVITIKGGGLYYREGAREGVMRPERILSFADTSGAGDVVSAAVVRGTVHEKDIEEIAADAMKAAAEYLADKDDENFFSRNQ